MLHSLFEVVVAKRLSVVEASRAASNQHEFNGTNAVKRIFGEAVKGTSEHQKHIAHFVYLADEDLEPIDELVEVTWYDARAKNHKRAAELRLYFKDNTVMQQAEPNDILIIAKRQTGEFFFFVVAAEAPVAAIIEAFFGITDSFSLAAPEALPSIQQLFSLLTNLMGLEAVRPEFQKTYTTLLTKRFGHAFPSTKDFTQFTRETCPIKTDNVDDQLVAYLSHEERLFRILEGQIFEPLKTRGFADVDEFINQALSFINRRKSRVGMSLELHIAAILEQNFVQFSPQPRTEAKEKPDFIFPSIAQYKNPTFPAKNLTMLAAKYSCKERWRQILGEANRIVVKHLITFERGISTAQTQGMQAASIQLVVPQPLFLTYTEYQQSQLMNFSEFIQMVKQIQVDSS